jgi:hypothetical protein
MITQTDIAGDPLAFPETTFTDEDCRWRPDLVGGREHPFRFGLPPRARWSNLPMLYDLTAIDERTRAHREDQPQAISRSSTASSSTAMKTSV